MTTTLDQHFLIDEAKAKKLVSAAEIETSDTVVEIGPGTGNVTKHIPKCRLILVERDEALAKQLREKFEDAEVLEGNALYLIDGLKFDVLLSSLPYSIAEPLFRKLVLLDFKRAVLVLPKDFVAKLEGGNSALSLVVNSFLQIKVLDRIPKTAFEPRPRVESAIVVVTRKGKPSKKEKLVQELYGQNDKKLKNALRETLVKLGKMTKNGAREAMLKMEIHKSTLDKNIKKLTLKEFNEVLSKLESAY